MQCSSGRAGNASSRIDVVSRCNRTLLDSQEYFGGRCRGLRLEVRRPQGGQDFRTEPRRPCHALRHWPGLCAPSPSTSVAPPALMIATPPASLDVCACSFSLLQSENLEDRFAPVVVHYAAVAMHSRVPRPFRRTLSEPLNVSTPSRFMALMVRLTVSMVSPRWSAMSRRVIGNSTVVASSR